jgi:hypothetical protein
MATFQKGILGGFSGTIGAVVGGNWKGIDYMRTQSSRRNFTPTQLQLEQQAKFTLMMRFLRTMNNLLMETFNNYAIKMTGYNAAFGYNVKEAVTGIYPAFAVDYPKVSVSRGGLPNADAPVAAATAGSKITFTWTDNSDGETILATDQAIMVVYCEEVNQSRYLLGGAARATGMDSITVAAFSGKQVQTWLGFISADGFKISDSAFTGAVTVS